MGQAYHHTKSFLGHVDNGIRTAKKVYSILEEPMRQLVGDTRHGRVHEKVMKAVTGYDELKHKIINHHDTIENHARGISDKFKKAGLSIGLE
jgi:hypothetical protein